MSLAAKIKISFALIIVFPILMICLFALAMGKYRIEMIEENYDISIEDSGILFDRTNMLDLITESLREQTNENISQEGFEPSLVEYWRNFDNEYGSDITSVIVYYNEEFIYNGMKPYDENIIYMLPEYDSISDISVATYYVGTSEKYLVKPVPFTNDDGTFGTVYIVGITKNPVPEIRSFAAEFLVICLVLIILAETCLTIWLYKSVLIPINRLKKAAQNITKGNLDFSVDYDSSDEFGQLNKAFEEMRVHLKESIEENIKNDTESKELISNISHDLKTPITAIKGYVEGIMDGVADTPEKMDRYIKTIYNKANDMDNLIGELTVYSRIDTNKIPYHFVKLNVAEYFEDCIEEITTELESRNFKLIYFNYTDKSTEVMADPEQIKRVINNIISNSLKYNDKDVGVINIRIKDQKDYVHFEIEDNGRGVAQEDLPYIFERFYRTDASRNSKKGGSGIGLSIVKKIIEAHGGTIWAFSTLETGLSIHFILKKAGNTEGICCDSEDDIQEKDKGKGKVSWNKKDKSEKRFLKYREKLSNIGGRENGK